LLADFLGKRRGKVALGGRAADGDDTLAFELRTLGHLDGGPDVGSGGNAGRQTFELGESLRGGEGVFIRDLNHFVQDFGVEVFRDESGSDALDHVRTRSAAGDHRAGDGLDGDDLDVAAGFDDFTHTGDGAARADAGD